MKRMLAVSSIGLALALAAGLAVAQSGGAPATQPEKKKILPGEQAPPMDAGQRNFGGAAPGAAAAGRGGARDAARPGAPGRGGGRPGGAGGAGPQSLDDLSMSDPFIYADEKTKTYYLTGSGGRLYKSPDLK